MNDINNVYNPRPVIDVTNKYLDLTRYSFRKFTDELNTVMVQDLGYTQAAIGLWAKYGQRPDYYRMAYLYHNTTPGDWRHDFALEMMMALRPEIWRSE